MFSKKYRLSYLPLFMRILMKKLQEALRMTHSVDEMLSMLGKYLIFDLAESFEQVRFGDKDNLIQVMKDIFWEQSVLL